VVLFNPESVLIVGIPGKHLPVLKSAYDNRTQYTTTDADLSSANNPLFIKAIGSLANKSSCISFLLCS
jgi:hypothetical protein